MADKKTDPKATKPSTKPSTVTSKPTPSVKPASPKPTTTPKSSGIMGSAANKQTQTAKPSGITGSAGKKPAPAPAPSKPSGGIMGSAGNKPAGTAKPAPAPAQPARQTPSPQQATRQAPPPQQRTAPAPRVAAQSSKQAPKPAKKPVKTKGDRPAKSSGGSAVARTNDKKVRFIIMAVVAFILILAIVIGIIVGTKSCNRGKNPPSVSGATGQPSTSPDKPASKDLLVLNPVNANDKAVADVLKDAYKFEHPARSTVGYFAKTVDTVERKKSTSVDGRTNESAKFPLGVETPNGQPRYPKYGSTLGYVVGAGDDKKAARNALIRESSYLTATGTANAGGGAYVWMDKDGKLYNGTVSAPQPALYDDGTTQRKLYKHDATFGLYLEGFGDKPVLADDEPGIVKEVTIQPRGYSGYSVTGVYAPAGEVIKIQISEADMEATGGLIIHIGQALYNGQANNIWADKGQMQRMPHLLNTMKVTKDTATLENGVYTAYVGSFLGGPLYIRNANKTFTATISGGVAYPHIILGYTSKEEYEESKKSTAPYFDLEVWNYGVLHSGPRYYSDGFSYEDLYKVATLWEKVSSVTTTGSNQGIVFLYDPFVAAGAAVAFPGRRSVNCPMGWMTGSLNYNGIVTSGSWGNFHEYHHNFQGYGVGAGGEVTNNAMTLVSYALFTKISSKRGIGSFGAQGLGGWNNYTSATWALEEALKIARPNVDPSNGNQGLALYATLLHNFGANNFIQAKVKGGGQSYQAYANAWEYVTHNNMTYYFNDILKGGITSTAPSEYPMFVPVSCVYQTGRSFMYDGEKKYFKTMQPYLIKNDVFDIDLGKYTAADGQYKSGSIVIPDGFSYTVKNVTKPQNGTIEAVEGGNNTLLRYTPAANAKTGSTSGQIVVTLEITKDNGSFKVDDVDLILEFEISQELNRMVLERTTYTYSAEKMYSDAVTAFDSGYAGYTDKKQADHANPTQNANTDIWLVGVGAEDKFPKATEEQKMVNNDNTVHVVDGKLYFENDGKYRVYLRGRKNCSVHYSLDGKNYSLGAKVTNGSGANFYVNDKNSYFDVEFDEGKVKVTTYCNGGEQTTDYTISKNEKGDIINWLYVKETLIVKIADGSYIGLGTKQWTETMFTMAETYYATNGATSASESDEEPATPITPDHAKYAYTITVYNDYNGNEVARTKKLKDGTTQYFKTVGNNHNVASTAQEVASLTEPKLIAPTSAGYVNAYRSNYDFPDNKSFESDYFYTRSYNCDYEEKETTYYSTWDEGVSIVETNYVPEKPQYGMDKILEAGSTTWCHNNPNTSVGVFITLDMGKTITANDITFQGRTDRNTSYTQQGLPTKFKLEVSTDGVTYTEAGEYTQKANGYISYAKLNNDYTFRYVKITILGTHSATGRLILSEIKFGYTFRLRGNGSNLIAPTNENVVFGKNWESKVAASSFGRVYVGKKGAKAVFEITGTRLAILSSSAFGTNFDVYIDGKKVNSIKGVSGTDAFACTSIYESLFNNGKRALDPKGAYGISYLSEALSEGKHKVEIRCTGEANIDSIAIFK